MTLPIVVNITAREAFDVYIGRRSRWGNPFLIGRDGSRERVIERYREYILRRPDLLLALGSLQGKRLGCHCSPAPCHGDVLVGLVRLRTEVQAIIRGEEVGAHDPATS